MNDQPEYVAYIDSDIKELVPDFIANRRQDAKSLNEACAREDFQSVRKIAHRIKGSGGSYGFTAISELGGEISKAAADGKQELLASIVARFEQYLEKVEIIYK